MKADSKQDHKPLRADLYLHYVRIYKTRSLSTHACNKSQVRVGGKSVKPSYALKIGDIVEATRGELKLIIKVTGYPPSRVGAKLVSQYLEDLTPIEHYQRAAEARKLRVMLTPHEQAAKPDKKQLRMIRAWKEHLFQWDGTGPDEPNFDDLSED